jgi:ADP-ribose pyrophosphatase YjhB (NUDIX family)
LYFGPTVAVGGIVSDDEGRILFLKRARDPGRGMLGIPGGFVDEGEDLEGAMVREVFEETKLEVIAMKYIASFPNAYHYRGLSYPVTDAFFVCQVKNLKTIHTDPSEVETHLFLDPTPKDLANLAFHSNRLAVEAFLATRLNEQKSSRRTLPP